MTHDDFLKSLNESVKPNIVKIPRRYIMKKTQNINGKIVPFNDKIVVEEVIRKRGI